MHSNFSGKTYCSRECFELENPKHAGYGGKMVAMAFQWGGPTKPS